MVKHKPIGFNPSDQRKVGLAELWDLAHANKSKVSVNMRDGYLVISSRTARGSQYTTRTTCPQEAYTVVLMLVKGFRAHSGTKARRDKATRREIAEARHASYNFRSNLYIGA